jgi:hypothetical protein
MKRPRIAIAWDDPTSSNSAGATRFILERQYGYPTTPIRTRQLAFADLSEFHVIILPDGRGYAGEFGRNGINRLKAWVAAGGTLVALGDGPVSFLADPQTGMLDISRENAVAKDKDGKAGGSNKSDQPAARVPGKLINSEEEFQKIIGSAVSLPDSVSGVLLRAKTDRDHWVTAGVRDSVNAIVRGNSIFTPIKIDNGVNAAYFAGPEEVLASGYLWEENRQQLAFKPFVVVQPTGRGNIVAFTADPNIRAYVDGLNLLFLNSVFRGVAHAR